MLIQSNKPTQPRHFIARFPGGASYCGLSIIFAAAIEKYTGKSLRDLHTGGFTAASGGSFGAIAATLPHPDNPKKPLFSMQEFEEMFFAELPNYIKHRKNFLRDQIVTGLAKKMTGAVSSRIFRSLAERPIHLDRAYMEQHLKKAFNGHLLSDTTRTLFINAQRISPSVQPYDFYHIEPGLLRSDSTLPSDQPHTSLPVYTCALATAALPGAYDAVTIPE
ncbi:MAG: patatin-like phospholipase family protein, partial [Alphaproteobacteria bacterium]|nr:patatin-like phospholipase family protein [Alphaproteobacteria bacterium]